MSWRIEIIPDNSDQWVTNGLRFATKEETEAYISTMHWTLVCETRVWSPTIRLTTAGSMASWCGGA